jgi:hypothetical protein
MLEEANREEENVEVAKVNEANEKETKVVEQKVDKDRQKIDEE